ncbi:AIG2-like protein [Hypoxylon sp. FL0890]|nr:AIG2-like protein [Hypoxylon sp. FL0890]
MGIPHSSLNIDPLAPTPAPPEPKPKPVFVCGTLCALPLLAWVLTKDSSNVGSVSNLARPARLHGYAPFTLLHCHYPAVIKHNSGTCVDGYLLTLETAAQRKKLDHFLGGTSTVRPVTVMLIDGNGMATEETVEADLHVWSGDKQYVTKKPWDLQKFIDKSLDYWLNIFERADSSNEGEDVA